MEPIPTETILKGAARQELIDQLNQKYNAGRAQRLLLLRKKYAWLFVVKGTRCVKRMVDLFGATAILITLSPLMLVVAAGIKLYDGGSVLYVQNRVGRWGKLFRFVKFRSMMANADQMKDLLGAENDHSSGATFKMKKDPRVTPLGYWIRRLSIDELPQLVCVVKGEMSLVGPRPPLPEEVETYSLHHRRRLDVKPGITCLWQIEGRSNIPFEGQLTLDLDYIESQSVWKDLWILIRTIPAVLLGRGAY